MRPIYLAAVAVAACGPSAALSAHHAAITVQYDMALARCKEQGKTAGSFAVFEACERAATRQICLDVPELRSTWARCSDAGAVQP